MKFINAIFYVIILASFVTSGCKTENDLSEKEANVIREEIMNTLQQYHRDIEKEGVLAELKYLDSTKQFSWMAPGFNSALNYDSVVSILKIMQPLYSKIQHSWDSLTVTPQSESEAIYAGTIHSILTNQQGQSDTMKLKEEGVLVRRNDGWKLLTGKTRLIH